MSDIYLSELFTNLAPLVCYKIHFAKQSNGSEPLDAFMRGMDEWKEWNRYSKARSEKVPKNDFNREYIFSLIDFYPEHDTWLFGGIWKVISRDMSPGNDYPYTIELSDDYSKFIGRLKIQYEHKKREVRMKMENYFPDFIVKELLDKEYTTYVFPGYKDLNAPFKTLENVMRKDNPAWKSALSIKGIYMITNTVTGMKYVGKASGENGLWQRWSDYISNGHGGDVDLIKLVASNGMEYVREHFRFSILEIVQEWDDKIIDKREIHWKTILMSRIETVGHNRN